jgi:hypothetical protein
VQPNSILLRISPCTIGATAVKQSILELLLLHKLAVRAALCPTVLCSLDGFQLVIAIFIHINEASV